ncbi:anthranilate synthase component I [Mycotypha africana]|uniref:anthranilate synthase component I n=1 Tax=Mycotypha africana TaxID=64632 RepID=UPI002300DDF3|nr:anthranilate synthase component I [Mycotypha africana]KAI8968904.1 anthranilate synthase component I [Mycotypha africana]
MTLKLKPTLEEVQAIVAAKKGNTIPIFAELEADFLTPVSAYLKVADRCDYSFLFESVEGGENISRYSFIGADPYKLIKVGPKESIQGDPLIPIEKELANIKYVKVPGLPSFTGGAVGYIGFDCFQYFEPKIQGELADPLGIPDAIFMMCDTLVVFDRVRQVVNVVSHYRSDATDPQAVQHEYTKAAEEIETTLSLLTQEHIPQVPQKPIQLGNVAKSNVGKEGYMGFVSRLKHHIKEGDIFQAVPSQRLARPTNLHPFNVYRHLRSLNPSPYLFYMNLKDFTLVGASPEVLTKVVDNVAFTNPIAGTRKRGKTAEEDKALEEDLINDPKERAEHVMLVDLGRNDINRICKPETVKVDKLMEIEYYSHVMHIVSNVSGKLRDDKTAFDAFRSIFPAGTVSGAPKIRAVELIRGLEKEKRGVYAGAVGHFDYSGDLDTCIAIRTMLFKDDVAYLQAGGGIVYDSVEEDEYQETMNKMGSNLATIDQCEAKIYEQQQQNAK